jgi:hypothetical protein
MVQSSRSGGRMLVASASVVGFGNDVEHCTAKIAAKFARRNLHAWVSGCFGAE